LPKPDRGTSLHADSAYKSAEHDKRLKILGIKNETHEKENRAGALNNAQRRHNCKKLKIRALFEHVFEFMENLMNRIFLRTIGLKGAKCVIGLANLFNNLCSYTQLIKLVRIQTA
jgi:hypothetical protein